MTNIKKELRAWHASNMLLARLKDINKKSVLYKRKSKKKIIKHSVTVFFYAVILIILLNLLPKG